MSAADAPVTSLRWKFLRDPDMLRVAGEMVALLLGTVIAFSLVIEPTLLDWFPALFPEPSEPGGIGRGDLPDTAVGWASGLAVVVVVLPALYLRVSYTERGRRLREKVHAELREGST